MSAIPQDGNEEAVLQARADHLRKSFVTRDASHLFWVVQIESGSVVGYGYGQLIDPAPYSENGTQRVGLVDEVFLWSEIRGQGFGRALIEHMVGALKGRGAEHVRLHSYAWNASANALYSRLGFVPYAYAWELNGRVDKQVEQWMDGFTVRSLREDDYSTIIAVLDQWWGGRPMTSLLPRLFFQHFSDTSWVVEDQGVLVAFLIGFISQSKVSQGYIHFVGVNPTYRGKGIGKGLYQAFFRTMRSRGVHSVMAITSPVNRNSIAFHQYMGFEIVGDESVDGVTVRKNYDGQGGDRVVFRKVLHPCDD